MEQASLAELMSPVAAQSGVNPSALPGVSFQRITSPLARAPAVYQPSLKIVGQGSIRSYLGREVYSYDADHYLALVVPLPVECEIQASLAEPLLFMSIDLDWPLLGALLAEMDFPELGKEALPRAVRAAPLTAELREATVRLLRCLHAPGRSPGAGAVDPTGNPLSGAPGPHGQSAARRCGPWQDLTASHGRGRLG